MATNLTFAIVVQKPTNVCVCVCVCVYTCVTHRSSIGTCMLNTHSAISSMTFNFLVCSEAKLK